MPAGALATRLFAQKTRELSLVRHNTAISSASETITRMSIPEPRHGWSKLPPLPR